MKTLEESLKVQRLREKNIQNELKFGCPYIQLCIGKSYRCPTKYKSCNEYKTYLEQGVYENE